MPRQLIQTDKVPLPTSPYSQAIRAGGFIFISGQLPLNLEGQIVGESIEAQTRQTLDNVKAILEAAGATLDDVVKVTVHLANLSDFPQFNAAYAPYFSEPKPARTTSGSALPGVLIQIDVIAYVGS